ncbi:hypothetical protein EVAR_61699_1 [Eumeta japonica]|uniref:Uncharacterized protein n=1 Tax=Eumeta variegata TaxID=151549 RepID=A0A4C1ZR24_EUMVA|nr:hypothetical protein EVAR_61699_1 [Eumeta japonica]
MRSFTLRWRVRARTYSHMFAGTVLELLSTTVVWLVRAPIALSISSVETMSFGILFKVECRFPQARPTPLLNCSLVVGGQSAMREPNLMSTGDPPCFAFLNSPRVRPRRFSPLEDGHYCGNVLSQSGRPGSSLTGSAGGFGDPRAVSLALWFLLVTGCFLWSVRGRDDNRRRRLRSHVLSPRGLFNLGWDAVLEQTDIPSVVGRGCHSYSGWFSPACFFGAFALFCPVWDSTFHATWLRIAIAAAWPVKLAAAMPNSVPSLLCILCTAWTSILSVLGLFGRPRILFRTGHTNQRHFVPPLGRRWGCGERLYYLARLVCLMIGDFDDTSLRLSKSIEWYQLHLYGVGLYLIVGMPADCFPLSFGYYIPSKGFIALDVVRPFTVSSDRWMTRRRGRLRIPAADRRTSEFKPLALVRGDAYHC